MPTEPKDILQRLSTLKTQREPWESNWQDITDYVLPRRSFWDIDSTPGKKPSVKIYDGSALEALQLLVDGLQGYLVSAKIRWSRLVMEDWRQQQLPDVPDWLEGVDDVLFAEFARSNFYEAIGEFFLDAASIGTAVMFVEDDVAAKRINFSTRHIKECYIAEGRTGMVDVVYRDFVMTNRQAYQTWGDKLCPQRLDQVKRDPFGSAHIVHACYPRAEYDDTKSDQMNAPVASCYLDKDHNKIIDEGGFQLFPYLAWRWRKNSDEIYGRSPASDSINDILRVNQIGKDMLEASHLAVYPPMNVPAAMRGMTKFIPRGENYYVKPDEVAMPINLAQNYPIGLDQENALKDQIRAAFRTKIFLLMEQLEKGPYTATEIRERQGEKAAVLGATIGRLNSEALVPLISRVYHICERNGLIPPPPPALVAGGRVKVEMQGPLAQSQKQYHELQGVNASLQFITGMAQMFPDSMDNVDADELMRRGLDSTGSPQKVIRELPQVMQIRRKKAQAIAAQQKAAVALEREKILGSNAEQLNQPLKPDSMLAAAAQAAGQGG
jgi:hypothetical protein